MQRVQNQGWIWKRITALAWSPPKSRKSVSAPEKVLLLAKPVGVSWVWDTFLAVPQNFQCDLGAYASCSHIRRNRHMSNLFHSWTASFVGFGGAWKHAPQTEAEACWICVSANCAGLRLRCSAVIYMQTHRKTTCANVVLLARWERRHGSVTARTVAGYRLTQWALALSLLQRAVQPWTERPDRRHWGQERVVFWRCLLFFLLNWSVLWRENRVATVTFKVKRSQKTKLLMLATGEQFLMSLLKLVRTWLEQSLWEGRAQSLCSLELRQESRGGRVLAHSGGVLYSCSPPGNC